MSAITRTVTYGTVKLGVSPAVRVRIEPAQVESDRYKWVAHLNETGTWLPVTDDEVTDIKEVTQSLYALEQTSTAEAWATSIDEALEANVTWNWAPRTADRIRR